MKAVLSLVFYEIAQLNFGLAIIISYAHVIVMATNLVSN